MQLRVKHRKVVIMTKISSAKAEKAWDNQEDITVKDLDDGIFFIINKEFFLHCDEAYNKSLSEELENQNVTEYELYK